MRIRNGYISVGGVDVYIQIGDDVFYGGDDLLMNADPSKFCILNEETGQMENAYEVLWKLAAEQLKQQYQPFDDGEYMSPEEFHELEDWVKQNVLKREVPDEN